jgi:hypothetical protein
MTIFIHKRTNFAELNHLDRSRPAARLSSKSRAVRGRARDASNDGHLGASHKDIWKPH